MAFAVVTASWTSWTSTDAYAAPLAVDVDAIAEAVVAKLEAKYGAASSLMRPLRSCRRAPTP